MNRIFQMVLYSDRRRQWAIQLTLLLLRQIYAAEDKALQRHSDELDEFQWDPAEGIPHGYGALEGKQSACEHALEFLCSAIDDLETLGDLR